MSGRKKWLAAGLCAALLATLLCGAASAEGGVPFAISYHRGLISNECVTDQVLTLTASGGDCITVEIDGFEALTGDATETDEGVYLQVYCVNFPSETVTVRGSGTQRLDYLGSTKPKENADVIIHVVLRNYAEAGSVKISGRISA